jgi:hypothetical protein
MAEIPTPIDILVPIIGSERFSELEDAREAVHKARRGSADWPPADYTYKTYQLCQREVKLERLRLAATQDWFARDRGPIPDDLLHIYIYETEEDATRKLARAEDAETKAHKKYEKLSPELLQSLDAKYQADAQRQAEAQSSTAPPPVGMLSLM